MFPFTSPILCVLVTFYLHVCFKLCNTLLLFKTDAVNYILKKFKHEAIT